MNIDETMTELEKLYDSETPTWRTRLASAWTWLRNKPERAWHGGIIGWQRRPLCLLLSRTRYWPSRRAR